jgi:SAM-dependent methyltransferase
MGQFSLGLGSIACGILVFYLIKRVLIMEPSRFTRGKGLLEPTLSRWRANQANRLIPADLRKGRILDIGCGAYPYFLTHTYFEEKFAIENGPQPNQLNGINWFCLNLNETPSLPFEDNYFSAITLLAVVEHLDPTSLVLLLQEGYRVLAPGGVLILTTPAAWSDGVLKLMARLALVSKEEIDEHVYAYTLPLIGWYFGKAGFQMTRLKFGYFESMLNMWSVARK